jgi:ribosomal protein L4
VLNYPKALDNANRSFKYKRSKTGRTIELPEEIFGIEPNDHVIYLAVNNTRALNARVHTK